MAKQTFIIRHWFGAPTYIEAARREVNEGHNPSEYDHDFNRVSVKQVKTALRYLKGWRDQALQRGWTTLFATLTRDDARYEIIATPNGYDGDEVVACGMMKDLKAA